MRSATNKNKKVGIKLQSFLQVPLYFLCRFILTTAAPNKAKIPPEEPTKFTQGETTEWYRDPLTTPITYINDIRTHYEMVKYFTEG